VTDPFGRLAVAVHCKPVETVVHVLVLIVTGATAGASTVPYGPVNESTTDWVEVGTVFRWRLELLVAAVGMIKENWAGVRALPEAPLALPVGGALPPPPHPARSTMADNAAMRRGNTAMGPSPNRKADFRLPP
jgi:hypothetical protein